MKFIFYLYLLTHFFTCPATAERPGYTTVLLYHRFEQPQYASTNISKTQFHEQMAYLKSAGYRVLSIPEFRQIYERGMPFPQKSVVITIDDNYRAIYDVAYPILKQFKYPFAVFPYTKALESGSPNLMTWQMVKEMYANGVAIGNHSHSHPHLGHPQKGQTQTDYIHWVKQELQQAKQALTQHHIETDIFAYPYGEYTPEIINQAKHLGYRLLFTQNEGSVDAATLSSAIPRIAIVGENMTLEKFIFKLNLSPLHVTDIAPPAGFLMKNPPKAFSLHIQNPARYRPGVINVFVSEWGHIETAFNRQTGHLSYTPTHKLTRPMNRLIVTAKEREGDHFSIYAQTFFLPFHTLTETTP